MKKIKMLIVIFAAILSLPSYVAFAEDNEIVAPSNDTIEANTPTEEENTQVPDEVQPDTPPKTEEPYTPPTNTTPKPITHNAYSQKTTTTTSQSTEKPKESPQEPNDEVSVPATEATDSTKNKQSDGPKISTTSEVADGKQLAEAKRDDVQQSWWMFVIAAAVIFILVQFINPNKRVRA